MLVFGALYLLDDNEKWVEEGEFTTGKISKINYIARGDRYSVGYNYSVDGIEYEGVESYPSGFGKPALQSKLLGSKKYVPVVYLPTEPEKSRCMLTEYDFKVLELNYPDSLKWIEQNIE